MATKTTETSRKLQEYLKKHLGQLIGGTVIAVGSSEVGWHTWPVLELMTKEGTLFQVQVSQDPEGNGPGHLFIDKIPTIRKLAPDLVGLTCDWGQCGDEAVAERATAEHGWLPVCKKHKEGEANAQAPRNGTGR